MQIAGYRSVREPLIVEVDRRITVVLGANDHGKTNVLEAITHLNPDNHFDAERDLNWDCVKQPEALPRIEFAFELSDDEKTELLALENERIRRDAIRQFSQSLDEAASAAEEKAGEADQRSVAANEHAETLRSESTDLEDDADLKTAEADVQLQTDTAEELRERASRARVRYHLAMAEERRVIASIAEQDDPDFKQQLEDAEAGLTRAEANLKRANTRLETATSAHDAAVGAYPAGSEEPAKAEKEKTAAAEGVERATHAANQARALVVPLREIVLALAREASGEVSFEKGAQPPKPTLVKLDGIPSSVTLGRVGVSGELQVIDPDGDGKEVLANFLLGRLPRVELIRPQERLSRHNDARVDPR